MIAPCPQLECSVEPVISGCAAVGAFGDDLDALSSRSGTRFTHDVTHELPGLPPIVSPTLAAAEGFDPARELGRRGLRALNRESKLLIVAAQRALKDAGLELSELSPEDIGVFVGTTYGGLDDYVRLQLEGIQWGVNRISPLRGPNTGPNAAAAHLAIRLGLRGENHTLCAGRLASLRAYDAAQWAVRTGRLKVALACGVDALSYARLCDGPSEGVPGEAAAVVVVEAIELAQGRGRRQLAPCAGVHSSAPQPRSPRGMLNAATLRGALDDCGQGPLDLVCVTSAFGSRAAVGAALREAVPGCTSGRTMWVEDAAGDCAGATGVLQLAASLHGLRKLAREDARQRNFTALVCGVDEEGYVAATAVTCPAELAKEKRS